jgi:DNA-binding NtrC family response regulator
VGNIGQTSSKYLRIDPPSSDITKTGKANLPDAPAEPSAAKVDPKDSNSVPNDFDTLSVEVWEQRLIQEALRRTQGNIPAAAELMGMSRATLYRKLEKSQIPLDPNPPEPNT